MKRCLIGIAFIAAIIGGQWPTDSFASSPFKPSTFKGFERNRPSKESVSGFRVDTSRPGLSLVVSQSCDVRPLSDEKKTFLVSLGESLGTPEVIALYTRELQVNEHDVGRWIPFQDETMDHLLQGPCETSEIGITVRYLAVHSTLGRIYAGIGYSRAAPQRPEPVRCFATEILGVEIGAPLADLRPRLIAKYGREMVVPRNGERQMWAYPVDEERQTVLIIGDGGNGPRERVFSVQVWGPPNPDLELADGVRLGQASSTVEGVLGAASSRKVTPDGFELLSFEGSPCSVELRDGVLASVMIVGDPNYFEE